MKTKGLFFVVYMRQSDKSDLALSLSMAGFFMSGGSSVICHKALLNLCSSKVGPTHDGRSERSRSDKIENVINPHYLEVTTNGWKRLSKQREKTQRRQK
jgi:hypothetical protein